MTEQDLYLRAIALNPRDAVAYHALGTTLLAGETITLENGTRMTKQELLDKR